MSHKVIYHTRHKSKKKIKSKNREETRTNKRKNYSSMSDSSDDEVSLATLQTNKHHNRLHYNHIIQESTQACEFCDRVFKNRYDSIIHNAKHIIIPLQKLITYRCEECLFCFTSKYRLSKHVNEKHFENRMDAELTDRLTDGLTDRLTDRQTDVDLDLEDIKPQIIVDTENMAEIIPIKNTKINYEDFIDDVSMAKIIPLCNQDSIDYDFNNILGINNIDQNNKFSYLNNEENTITLHSSEVNSKNVIILPINEIQAEIKKNIINEEIIIPDLNLEHINANHEILPEMKCCQFDVTDYSEVQEECILPEMENCQFDVTDDSDVSESSQDVKDFLGNDDIEWAINNIDSIELDEKFYNEIDDKDEILKHFESKRVMKSRIKFEEDFIENDTAISKSKVSNEVVEINNFESTHYDDLIKIGSFKCRVCAMVFHNRYQLIQHEPVHWRMDFSSLRKYNVCMYCDRIISGTYRQIRKHISKKHGHKEKKKIALKKCNMCNLPFYNFYKHSKIYHELYECCICNRKFETSKSLTQHVQQHGCGSAGTSTVSLTADRCQVKNGGNIARNFTTKFACKFCSNIYLNNREYSKVGAIKHEGFTCSFCKKLISDIIVLKRCKVKKMTNTERYINITKRLKKLKILNRF